MILFTQIPDHFLIFEKRLIKLNFGELEYLDILKILARKAK